MQVLQYANDKAVSSWQDDSGSYIRGFLISTKSNKNKWKIKNTDLVQNFIGKDFAVIPNRIGNQLLLDGHVVGSREEVLKAYSDNSYGKISKILGPFPYSDGTNDVYFEHITKLHNDRVASALLKHGSGTLVQFATSPHIFGVEGNDSDGWDKWEPAGIVLVSNPAYGQQSVISKMCYGKAEVCSGALGQAQENKIASVVSLLSSFIDSDAKNNISMSSNNDSTALNAPEAGKNLTDTTLQTQEKTLVVDPITNKTNVPEQPVQDKQVPEQSQTEEVKILKQKIAEMENEKKNEILLDMFAVLTDEKERDKSIKEIAAANDLNTIKYIKTIVDALAPLYKKQGETELQKQIRQKEEIQKAEQLKFSKNKVASVKKFSLPGEPCLETPEPGSGEGEGEGGGEGTKNKVASRKAVGEVVELLGYLGNKGRMTI